MLLAQLMVNVTIGESSSSSSSSWNSVWKTYMWLRPSVTSLAIRTSAKPFVFSFFIAAAISCKLIDKWLLKRLKLETHLWQFWNLYHGNSIFSSMECLVDMDLVLMVNNSIYYCIRQIVFMVISKEIVSNICINQMTNDDFADKMLLSTLT